MSAKESADYSGELFNGGFEEIAGYVNAQFTDAVVTNEESRHHAYFTIGSHPNAAHRLGVFSIAAGIESLWRRKAEILGLSVPLVRADLKHPESVLGTGSQADYFFIRYMAERGGQKVLRVDPAIYERRFHGAGKPPIRDLAQKLVEYKPLPLLDQVVERPEPEEPRPTA